eukprot:Filipodium_phascolosomae@DN6298_c0_g1_i1.p1
MGQPMHPGQRWRQGASGQALLGNGASMQLLRRPQLAPRGSPNFFHLRYFCIQSHSYIAADTGATTQLYEFNVDSQWRRFVETFMATTKFKRRRTKNRTHSCLLPISSAGEGGLVGGAGLLGLISPQEHTPIIPSYSPI